MSSLRLLALRWSMTTPYWCTLTTFRSLPPAVNPAADDQSARRASLPSPGATRLPHLLPWPHTPTGRSGMFQRFTSALFGDDVEELSRCSRPGDKEGEEDEDWILVNYLGKCREESAPAPLCDELNQQNPPPLLAVVVTWSIMWRITNMKWVKHVFKQIWVTMIQSNQGAARFVQPEQVEDTLDVLMSGESWSKFPERSDIKKRSQSKQTRHPESSSYTHSNTHCILNRTHCSRVHMAHSDSWHRSVWPGVHPPPVLTRLDLSPIPQLCELVRQEGGETEAGVASGSLWKSTCKQVKQKPQRNWWR